MPHASDKAQCVLLYIVQFQVLDDLSWHELAADPDRHASLTSAAVEVCDLKLSRLIVDQLASIRIFHSTNN